MIVYRLKTLLITFFNCSIPEKTPLIGLQYLITTLIKNTFNCIQKYNV